MRRKNIPTYSLSLHHKLNNAHPSSLCRAEEFLPEIANENNSVDVAYSKRYIFKYVIPTHCMIFSVLNIDTRLPYQHITDPYCWI